MVRTFISHMRVQSVVVAALTMCSVALCGCNKPHTDPEFIQAAKGPVRPFSPAVRANGFLILSGQIGTDSSGAIVQGGIQAETRQAMQNIKKVLADNGSSMDRVVKCTVFLGDMNEWAAMNEVYTTFFADGRKPARSAMGANGLALGSKVEIECLAAE